MDTKAINPWQWQDSFGFSQGISVENPQRLLVCAGQTSVDANGAPVHVGDMGGQIKQALDNLEAVLAGANMTLGNVVRLNYYTTDVDTMMQEYPGMVARLEGAGCCPASTLLGVARLAFPELLVEIEATAML
jgi:enamine deaminase RidA (YjgF/YER057c/UK114 family)